jgi:5-methylcytosine-specific restriction endonuclease McrA
MLDPNKYTSVAAFIRAMKNRGQKRSPEICTKFSAVRLRDVDRLIAERGCYITQEQREKISKTLTGRKLTEECKAKIRAANPPGICRAPREHFEKLSRLYKGKPFSGKSFDHTGRRQSLEERMRRRLVYPRGPKHWNWKPGPRERNRRKDDPQYATWRMLVFDRDNYKCQDCGAEKTYITAHHIKPWRDYVELRYDVSNGITLCPECHAKVDKYYRRSLGNLIKGRSK